MSEAYKDSGVTLPLPVGIFDACAECGEPIEGAAEVAVLAGLAWHDECSPTRKMARHLATALDRSLGG